MGRGRIFRSRVRKEQTEEKPTARIEWEQRKSVLSWVCSLWHLAHKKVDGTGGFAQAILTPNHCARVVHFTGRTDDSTSVFPAV